MTNQRLRGVIAAIATPMAIQGDPDTDRLIALARDLLSDGCDGLNLLGTTGEANSLTVGQRKAVMQAIADSDLPLSRFMVGTGATALGDAIELTQCAANLGFAGALVLPPYYYKPVSDQGIIDFFAAIISATKAPEIPIYLYNFPALSGIPFTPALTDALLQAFGQRIAGLKDSSGNLEYAAEIAALSPALDVFPSNEGTLLRARSGEFAGCISATANLNARHCAAAFQHGNADALAKAVAIRAVCDGVPLVPAVKALIAHQRQDAAYAATLPPLCTLSPDETALVISRYEQTSE